MMGQDPMSYKQNLKYTSNIFQTFKIYQEKRTFIFNKLMGMSITVWMSVLLKLSDLENKVKNDLAHLYFNVYLSYLLLQGDP